MSAGNSIFGMLFVDICVFMFLLIILSPWFSDWIRHARRTKTQLHQRIVCAAIRNGRGEVIIGCRHYDPLMHRQLKRVSSFSTNRPIEQGFVDNFGKFLDRKEAHKVASAAGQIIRRCGGDEETLYSENLY